MPTDRNRGVDRLQAAGTATGCLLGADIIDHFVAMHAELAALKTSLAALAPTDRRFVRADDPETTRYMEGWDDCRAAVLDIIGCGQQAGECKETAPGLNSAADNSRLPDIPGGHDAGA